MKKINMTREENVFFAKRNLVDTIYRSIKLEGLAVTFPQTEVIIHGGEISGVRADEVIAVNNLKHAWSFLLDNLDYPLDYAYLCKLHQLVGSNLIQSPGYLRRGEVTIGGIDPSVWKPDIPNEEQFCFEMRKLRLIENPVDRAIDTMLYCMRYQPFWDGNKRTAMLAANQILIANGCGIVSVPESKLVDFKKQVIDYYLTNDMKTIKNFILENCVNGIDMSKERNAVKKELPPLDMKIALAELEKDKLDYEKFFSTENIKQHKDKEEKER